MPAGFEEENMQMAGRSFLPVVFVVAFVNFSGGKNGYLPGFCLCGIINMYVQRHTGIDWMRK